MPSRSSSARTEGGGKAARLPSCSAGACKELAQALRPIRSLRPAGLFRAAELVRGVYVPHWRDSGYPVGSVRSSRRPQTSTHDNLKSGYTKCRLHRCARWSGSRSNVVGSNAGKSWKSAATDQTFPGRSSGQLSAGFSGTRSDQDAAATSPRLAVRWQERRSAQTSVGVKHRYTARTFNAAQPWKTTPAPNTGTLRTRLEGSFIACRPRPRQVEP